MKEPNRERKGDIKYNITLNEEQKLAKSLIINNQIVIITGRAGSGKSLICAQAALDFLMKKECEHIYVTRATIEVGGSLGFLPGSLEDKFNPYLEAFQENLERCYDKIKIKALVEAKKIIAYPIQFIRGKTIDDILVVEEAQNLSKNEMLAILTRLGKNGKIIINGDNEQKDIKETYTGLSYAIDLSKKIEGVEWIKLKTNHRSDLVGKILDHEYN
jgi:phosphate starvation-inducible protein PhoH and related proteins